MIEHQDVIDFSNLPQSKGIGTGTRWILAVGIVMIFCIGGLTVGFAYWGHMWPSDHTLRMDLGNLSK
ncbi:MAG TPA: hypothetical protein VMF11_03625 [Candidatus Baltobacteraceae bacterium]|nr:hypothetical protein [Candidatus Baltobacteraceae bacterium]